MTFILVGRISTKRFPSGFGDRSQHCSHHHTGCGWSGNGISPLKWWLERGAQETRAPGEGGSRESITHLLAGTAWLDTQPAIPQGLSLSLHLVTQPRTNSQNQAVCLCSLGYTRVPPPGVFISASGLPCGGRDHTAVGLPQPGSMPGPAGPAHTACCSGVGTAGRPSAL